MTEHFRNYNRGRYFTGISDHKALLTLSNSSPIENKTFFRRVTRWCDRLLPYVFKVEHREVSKWGWQTICLVFHLQRHPKQIEVLQLRKKTNDKQCIKTYGTVKS